MDFKRGRIFIPAQFPFSSSSVYQKTFTRKHVQDIVDVKLRIHVYTTITIKKTYEQEESIKDLQGCSFPGFVR